MAFENPEVGEEFSPDNYFLLEGHQLAPENGDGGIEPTSEGSLTTEPPPSPPPSTTDEIRPAPSDTDGTPEVNDTSEFDGIFQATDPAGTGVSIDISDISRAGAGQGFDLSGIFSEFAGLGQTIRELQARFVDGTQEKLSSEVVNTLLVAAFVGAFLRRM